MLEIQDLFLDDSDSIHCLQAFLAVILVDHQRRAAGSPNDTLASRYTSLDCGCFSRMRKSLTLGLHVRTSFGLYACRSTAAISNIRPYTCGCGQADLSGCAGVADTTDQHSNWPVVASLPPLNWALISSQVFSAPRRVHFFGEFPRATGSFSAFKLVDGFFTGARSQSTVTSSRSSVSLSARTWFFAKFSTPVASARTMGFCPRPPKAATRRGVATGRDCNLRIAGRTAWREPPHDASGTTR